MEHSKAVTQAVQLWGQVQRQVNLVRGGNPLNTGEKTVEHFHSVKSTYMGVTNDWPLLRRKPSRVWLKTPEIHISHGGTSNPGEGRDSGFTEKKLSERRFARFQAGMKEVKERGFYDKADIQMVKNLRRDKGETTDRMKEIIKMLKGA